VGEAVDECDEAAGAQDRAGHVDAALTGLGLGQEARGERHHEHADRHVDEHGPAPVHLGQRAAEDQADRRTGTGHRGIHAHGAVARTAGGEGRGDQRQGRGGGECRPDALQGAGPEQHPLALREAAEQRGAGEHEDTGHEHPAAPEQVAQAATQEEQSAEGQGVGRDDPREVLLGEAEVGHDVRHRDVHDRAVEHDHELGRTDHRERDPEVMAPAAGDVVRRGGFRCRGVLDRNSGRHGCS
jgi:hypothetical protein